MPGNLIVLAGKPNAGKTAFLLNAARFHTKLATGIVFVAIQKNPCAEHGLGDVRGLERARLYLAMEPGKLVIRKGKAPCKRTVKPDGKTFYFRIDDGCRFVVKGGVRQ